MKTLQTERMILRAFKKSDLLDLYDYARNPRVGPPAGWEAHSTPAVSKGVLKTLIEQKDSWAIELRENRRVIGSVGLHRDDKRPGINSKMLGYAMAEEYWGRGLMTEAARAVVDYAFRCEGLDVLSAYHYPNNDRSRRVIEKCGFVREGILRSCSKLYNGRVLDNVCYSLLRAEYEQRVRPHLP